MPHTVKIAGVNVPEKDVLHLALALRRLGARATADALEDALVAGAARFDFDDTGRVAALRALKFAPDPLVALQTALLEHDTSSGARERLSGSVDPELAY
jgi:hypothetical protein